MGGVTWEDVMDELLELVPAVPAEVCGESGSTDPQGSLLTLALVPPVLAEVCGESGSTDLQSSLSASAVEESSLSHYRLLELKRPVPAAVCGESGSTDSQGSLSTFAVERSSKSIHDSMDVLHRCYALRWQLQGPQIEPPRTREKVDETKCKEPCYAEQRPSVTIADAVKEHVLPLLPAKSICRFRAVSKDWNQWLRGPFLAHKQSVCCRDVSGIFAEFHGNFLLSIQFVSLCKTAYGVPDPSLSFLPEEVNIRASCNGLLCCQGLESIKYYICNPVRKDWKVLPDPIYYHGPESAALLAFEPQTFNFRASYDLVCAIPLRDTDLIVFEMYSSRSKSWRVSESVCDELKGAELTGNGLYFGGSLFWEVVTYSEYEIARYVLSLNIRDEQYGIIKLPDTDGSAGALAEIRGALCYIVAHNYPREIHIYGGMDMSLKSKIKLNLIHVRKEIDDLENPHVCFRALACVDDGDVVLLLLGNMAVSYCLSKRRAIVLQSDTSLESESKFFLYVNSLVEFPSLQLNDF